MKKSLWVWLLIIALTVVPNFAAVSVHYDAVTTEAQISIDNLTEGETVNVVVEKDGRRYFVDAQKATGSTHVFRTQLPQNIGALDVVVSGEGFSERALLETGETTVVLNPDTFESERADAIALNVTPKVDSVLPIKSHTARKQRVEVTLNNAQTVSMSADLSQLKEGMPRFICRRDAYELDVPKGTVITGNTSRIALMDPLSVAEPSLQNQADALGVTFSKAIRLGSVVRTDFDRHVTLVFKGEGAKEVLWVEGATTTKVPKDAGQEHDVYAYRSGNDLIVKTKHFTDFVTYQPKDASGGDTKPPVQDTVQVTLSIDKLTIGKGYVVASETRTANSGDTVWDVLKKALDEKGISYAHTFTPKYNSVYVEMIDGDGEFDHGSGSGWMYNVNGSYPNYGCSLYTVSNGDKIEWRYTTNLGADLGVDLSQWETDEEKPQSQPENTTNKTDVLETEQVPKGLKNAFKDVDRLSKWAIEGVEAVFDKGLIKGSDGYLYPKREITRAEFTKLLVAMLALPSVDDAYAHYDDVLSTAWYYDVINTARAYGISQGTGNRFYPNRVISRQEMATMLYRVMALDEKKTSTFTDDAQIAAWAREGVYTLAANDVLKGNGEAFEPQDVSTREMAFVVLSRCLDLPKKQLETKVTPVAEAVAAAAQYVGNSVTSPIVSSVGGEWAVIGLQRSGYRTPQAFKSAYLEALKKTLDEKNGQLHRIKYTEYDRVLLALASLDIDGTNFEGYNLVAPLSDFNTAVKQGLNGPIWALIALDAREYVLPQEADVPVVATRQMYVDYILEREIAGGGFSLTSEAPADVDITAMALTSLAAYKDQPKVKTAIERALKFLESEQNPDGSFSSNWDTQASSESISQVIVALSTLDIDALTDERFVKNGNSPVAALLTFQTKNGGFKHVKTGDTDQMATEQALYALAAYQRYYNKQPALYHMSTMK